MADFLLGYALGISTVAFVVLGYFLGKPRPLAQTATTPNRPKLPRGPVNMPHQPMAPIPLSAAARRERRERRKREAEEAKITAGEQGAFNADRGN